jgi:hypothetical protein
MADYAPVASQYKPVQPMTLAEMMNLANSAQAYKQAEQLNPLAVQRSASELSRLQQLTPEELRRAKAEAGRAETEADVAEQTSKPRVTSATAGASTAESTAEQERLKLFAQKQKQIASSQIAMINNPLIVAAEKNPNAANKEALVNLVMRNGMTIARDLGIKPDEAKALLQPYMDIATNNPGQLRQYFKERHLAGLDEASRTSALQPSGIGVTSGIQSQVTSMNEFGPVPIGQALPGTSVTMQLMPNESMGLDAANNPIIITKNSNGQITSIRPADQAGAGGSAPPAFINNPPRPASSTAPAPAPKVAPVGDRSVVAPKQSSLVTNLPPVAETNLPDYSVPVRPRFPVRVAGQTVMTLQQGEKEAQAAGGEYVRNIVSQRGAVAPVRNNLEKIMQTTDTLLAKQGFQAGKGLQVEQYLTKLVDDSEYKTLSKELANLQIALIGNNPQALSSDAGKQMTAAASGTEVYPPKVLQKIAIQLHGEMENRDRQGIAADKYARKFGESNMGSFTQMWNNNSDAKVFELMSLPKLVKDPQMRAKMADEIIGYPRNSEQRKVFEQKYKNIQKLIKDGTL